jgi:hypothetical protein
MIGIVCARLRIVGSQCSPSGTAPLGAQDRHDRRPRPVGPGARRELGSDRHSHTAR